MLYIGSDHGGFELKEIIKKFLKKQHIAFQDCGADYYNPDDDYPAFAEQVGTQVIKNNKNLGILLCKSGQGVCIAANKIHGIRAALCWDSVSAYHSRNDDNANILCLPANFLTSKQVILIIKKWLATPFSREPRYKKRINQILKSEKTLN